MKKKMHIFYKIAFSKGNNKDHKTPSSCIFFLLEKLLILFVKNTMVNQLLLFCRVAETRAEEPEAMEEDDVK